MPAEIIISLLVSLDVILFVREYCAIVHVVECFDGRPSRSETQLSKVEGRGLWLRPRPLLLSSLPGTLLSNGLSADECPKFEDSTRTRPVC